MKRPILVLVFALGILGQFSCKSTPTPKEVDTDQTEEVDPDTMEYRLLEEEEGY
jgi:hypothetical protein